MDQPSSFVIIIVSLLYCQATSSRMSVALWTIKRDTHSTRMASIHRIANGRFRIARQGNALRTTTTLFRLFARYALFCFLVVVAGLALRAGQEAGWGLGGAMPPLNARGMTMPALGVTVQMDDLSAEERRNALDRLAAAGIEWVRLRIDWGEIEPEPGAFDWGHTDALLSAVAAVGLEPVVVLDGSPAWARHRLDVGAANAPLAPPEDPRAFAPFAAAFAQRYAPRVRAYQIWDEPNIAPHWGNHRIDPVGYTQLLKVGAEAIRAVDGDAIILAAALAPTADRGHTAIDEVYFLQRMVGAGAAPYMDAIAIQPFGFGYTPFNATQSLRVLNFQRAALVRRALVNIGLGEMPIWTMRFGWNVRHDSQWGTVTPEMQRDYLAGARSVDAAWRWLPSLGWAIDQPEDPQEDPFWGFALNDDLLATLTAPVAPAPPVDRATPAWWLAGALLLMAAVLVDGVRDLRRLPLDRWRTRLANAPWWFEAGAWTGVIVVYHLATASWLIGACWLIGALLAWMRPRTALLLALTLLPYYFQHKEIALPNRVIAIPPVTMLALALVPALLGTTWQTRGRIAFPRATERWYDWTAAGWLLLTLISAAGVWNLPEYLRGVVELALTPLLLYAAVRLYITEERHVHYAIIALFTGGASIALLGIWRWAGGEGVAIDGVLRLVGTHFSPNHTALYLVRTLFLGIGLAFAVRGWRRNLWLVVSGVVGVALLLTASRGALLLGLPAGALTCLWLWLIADAQPAGQRLRTLLHKPGIRIAMLSTPLLLMSAIFLGESRLLNASSVDSRLLLWQAALALWRDHVWAGVGPGGFFWNYPAFLPIGAAVESDLLHPHNLWLEAATGWGVPGLLWIIALLALWLYHAATVIDRLSLRLRWYAIGLSAALVAAVAHAQVDAFLALADLAGWLFAAMGLWAALVERAHFTQKNSQNI